VTVESVPGGLLIRIALFSASTAGFPGAGGRPTGVAGAPAGVKAPGPDGPTAATSHTYAVPLTSPSTVASLVSNTPSFEPIHFPSPALHWTR